MNWFLIAQRDYSIYQDNTRIAAFVKNGKISAEQYLEITGEEYVETA
jgi:Phage uncharacterised protein (Phage_XkdX)